MTLFALPLSLLLAAAGPIDGEIAPDAPLAAEEAPAPDPVVSAAAAAAGGVVGYGIFAAVAGGAAYAALTGTDQESRSLQVVALLAAVASPIAGSLGAALAMLPLREPSGVVEGFNTCLDCGGTCVEGPTVASRFVLDVVIGGCGGCAPSMCGGCGGCLRPVRGLLGDDPGPLLGGDRRSRDDVYTAGAWTGAGIIGGAVAGVLVGYLVDAQPEPGLVWATGLTGAGAGALLGGAWGGMYGALVAGHDDDNRGGDE